MYINNTSIKSSLREQNLYIYILSDSQSFSLTIELWTFTCAFVEVWAVVAFGSAFAHIFWGCHIFWLAWFLSYFAVSSLDMLLQISFLIEGHGATWLSAWEGFFLSMYTEMRVEFFKWCEYFVADWFLALGEQRLNIFRAFFTVLEQCMFDSLVFLLVITVVAFVLLLLWIKMTFALVKTLYL